jgi:hypothetical protein
MAARRSLLYSLLLATLCLGQCLPRQKPMLGESIDWAQSLSKGIVGYWPLNEGSGNRANDLSGRNNTGTISGATWGQGCFGPAIVSTGSSQYVQTAQDPLQNRPCLTVSLWARGTSPTISGDETVIQDTPGGGYFAVMIQRRTNSAWWFWVSTNSNTVWIQSVTPCNTTNWFHLAVVYDGAYVTAYVNGRPEGAPGALTGNTYVYSSPSQQVLRMGQWPGTTDNVHVYHRALTAAEVAELYRSPFAMCEHQRPELYVSGGAAPTVKPSPYYYLMQRAELAPPVAILGIVAAFLLARRRSCQD